MTHKKAGRPPSGLPHFKPFNMKVPEGFMEMLDAWRAQQAPIPTRAEAIRMLVTDAIKAHARRRKKKGAT